jgi:hypothetical protein
MSTLPSASVSSDTGRCLYCLEAGKPPSIEHIVNAALGPHAADLTLPRGAVCEPCNQHLGRQVDEAFFHQFEIQLIRGIFRVPDRNGKTLDELPLGNGRVLFTREEMLHIEINGNGHIREADPGNLRIDMIANRRNSGDQMRRATRSLLKTGLGLTYLAYGAETALGAGHDELRGAIFGEPYEGYLLIGELDLLEWPNLSVSLLHDLPGINRGVQLRYGGFDVIADLALGSANDAVRDWAKENSYRIMDIAPKSGR